MSNRRSQGFAELREARAKSRGLFWSVGLFSFFANLLLLTGPIYMMQVYDRVLSSRSEATLIALSALAIFMYAVMGILDYTRGRIMALSLIHISEPTRRSYISYAVFCL